MSWYWLDVPLAAALFYGMGRGQRVAGAGLRAERGSDVSLSVVMFMDCPAYMDRHGTARCGLPAAVEYRYTVATMTGLVKSAKIRCPRGHWFNGPVEALTWEEHPTATTDRTRPGQHPNWRPAKK